MNDYTEAMDEEHVPKYPYWLNRRKQREAEEAKSLEMLDRRNQ